MAKGFFETLNITDEEAKRPGIDSISKSRAVIAERLEGQLSKFAKDRHASVQGRGKWFRMAEDTVLLHIYYRHHTLAFGPEQKQTIKIPEKDFVETIKAMVEGVYAGDIDEEIEAVDQLVAEEKASRAKTEEEAASLSKSTGIKHSAMRHRDRSENHGYYIVREEKADVQTA